MVFRCEGWPLCLHDKTVIQLAPVNPLLLRPGDFYLQVEPFGDQAARIVLKSLLEEGCREVEETPIPETSYACIFTEEWLQDVNEGRHGTPLSRCLLCTDQGVIKLPWAKIAIPEFLDMPKIVPMYREAPPEPTEISVPSHFNSSTLPVETILLPAKDRMSASLRPVNCSFKTEQERRNLKSCSKPLIKPVGWVSPNTWDSREAYREIEGDYVDLVDIAKGKEFVDKPKDSHLNPSGPVLFKPVRPPPPVPLGTSAPCGRPLQHAEESCTLCSQRRLEHHDPADHDLKCRYRDSYVAALRNPVTFERGSVDPLATLEEVGGLCEEGELESKGTFEAQKEGHDNICNHCNKPLSKELCQYRHCCPTAQDKFVSQLKDHHASCESGGLVEEPHMVLKTIPVTMKLISQQSGTHGSATPGSDAFLGNCDGDVRPHQATEAVKPSGKHKVKVRSLSTVSETPRGSPHLYKLNTRSNSDICPETISSVVQSKKVLDHVSPNPDRWKSPRKGMA